MRGELTEKQQRIWDLYRPVDDGGSGHKAKDIAVELGISLPVVRSTLTIVRAKLGIDGLRGADPKRLGLEVTDPERFVKQLDVASEPEKLLPIIRALEDAGIPGKAAQAYVARLKRRYPGVLGVSRALKTSEITSMLETKIHMALEAMDEHVVLEASFRDLALGATAMIEKRQLLRGEPTQIISDHERKKLNELTPLLIAEARRRGITVEGEVVSKVEVVVEAASAEPARA